MFLPPKNIGGLLIDAGPGTVVYEYSKVERHGATAAGNPNRFDPKRVGVVFYRHRGLDKPNHGKKAD